MYHIILKRWLTSFKMISQLYDSVNERYNQKHNTWRIPELRSAQFTLVSVYNIHLCRASFLLFCRKRVRCTLGHFFIFKNFIKFVISLPKVSLIEGINILGFEINVQPELMNPLCWINLCEKGGMLDESSSIMF